MSSETCALNLVGAHIVREVEPGEVVIFGPGGIETIRIPVNVKRRFGCAFEFVYFARPDSVIDGRSVYEVRKALGKKLAKRAPCPQAHLVTGMPDSGTIASMGYAGESTIPYEQTVVRNRYVGRTFIEPTQRVRELGVRIKLNPIEEIISGKNVVVVDDSIVRGTTCQRMISMIKACGASQVHVRISSPPVRFPCYYGIDTPTRVELAAAKMNLRELEREVGADSLAYITEEDMIDAIGLPADTVFTACFPEITWKGRKTVSLDYKGAGVNIPLADQWVETLKGIVRSMPADTNVRGGIGGFSGLYSLPGGMILAGCCDGVGTKIEVARAAGKFDGVGQDLVAMNVNDLVTCGARPLFFLDYIACGKLDPAVLTPIVESAARACVESGCALLGGETAEMPGVYGEGWT